MGFTSWDIVHTWIMKIQVRLSTIPEVSRSQTASTEGVLDSGNLGTKGGMQVCGVMRLLWNNNLRCVC